MHHIQISLYTTLIHVVYGTDTLYTYKFHFSDCQEIGITQLPQFIRMEVQPGLHDLLRGVSPSQLTTQCTDEHLADIASKIVTWETLAPYMKISEAEEEVIKHERTYEEQKLACLQKWRRKYSYEATYQHLIQIFCKAEEVDLGYKVATMMKHVAPISSWEKDELDEYHHYLTENYRQEPAPGTAEFPFNLASNFQYIKLLLQIRTRAGVESLEMEDIFTYGEEERKVTLIQGAAGSGKSTLVWELKRRWARGELYPEIQLLISINLRDPQYHMAKDLTDIIPCPDDKLKQAVAAHINRQFGAGVCFIWDGWDEVPYKYQRNSYIYKLLTGTPGYALPRTTFLVTSRSIGTTIVRAIAPKHIEIKPFSPQQIIEYFCRNANLTITEVEEYAKHNEQFLALCDLPVNASLVSCTLSDPRYKDGSLLPKTQTELYTNLTTNLLFSESERRTEMDNLDELPDSSKSVFMKFCKLAYHGLDKTVFFKKELASHGIDITGLDHTQGLMIVNPVFTRLGLDNSYTFRHLTIQEYMAARYLSDQLQSPQEQSEALFRINRHHPDRMEVLGFFAGMKNLNCSSIIQKLWRDFLQSRTDDSQRLFHLLMKCAFEAQSEGFFQLFHDSLLSSESTTLALKHFKLGYQDLGMLGRILGMIKGQLSLTLDATSCILDVGALAVFTKELIASKCCPTGLTLILDGTRLLDDDIKALEALISKTTALVCLSINDCGLNDRHIQVIEKAVEVAHNRTSVTGLAKFHHPLAKNIRVSFC